MEATVIQQRTPRFKSPRLSTGSVAFPVQLRDIEPYLAVSVPLWKRAFDLVLASVVLLVSLPVMLIVGALIKIVSPGPVLFRQERVGYKQQPFTLYKFRTMRMNTKACNHDQYMKELIQGEVSKNEKPMAKLDEHNPDIIPFGHFLRTACLDELPQLINVLKGDMSLVGPRPCLVYEAKEFLPWHTARFDILPGISGLWQVNGKNETTFREMIRMDLRYKNNMSFVTDMVIIAKTAIYIMNKLKSKIIPTG